MDRRAIEKVTQLVVQCVVQCHGSPAGSAFAQAVLAVVPALTAGALVGACRLTVAGRGVSRAAGSVLVALLRGAQGWVRPADGVLRGGGHVRPPARDQACCHAMAARTWDASMHTRARSRALASCVVHVLGPVLEACVTRGREPR